MSRKYTTRQGATGYNAKVCNIDGSNTGFSIVVPYNSPMKFSIGSTHFEVRQIKGKYFAYPDSALPFQWFINLNEA